MISLLSGAEDEDGRAMVRISAHATPEPEPEPGHSQTHQAPLPAREQLPIAVKSQTVRVLRPESAGHDDECIFWLHPGGDPAAASSGLVIILSTPHSTRKSMRPRFHWPPTPEPGLR